MKTIFAALVFSAICMGCATNDRGGVSTRSDEERGYYRSGGTYDRTAPSPASRDFPARVGPGEPGEVRSLDPHTPY